METNSSDTRSNSKPAQLTDSVSQELEDIAPDRAVAELVKMKAAHVLNVRHQNYSGPFIGFGDSSD